MNNAIARIENLQDAMECGLVVLEESSFVELIDLVGRNEEEKFKGAHGSFESYIEDGPSTWIKCGSIEIEEGEGWKFATIQHVQALNGMALKTVYVVAIEGVEGTFVYIH